MYQKGDFIDAYEVLEQLFVGERSQIYLVYCESLDCNLVIKCACSNNIDTAAKNNDTKIVNDTFLCQARLMHKFSNEAYIARLMHIGSVEQGPYILMPQYQQNLAEYLASQRDRITAHKSINFIKQILLAINTLHDKGVLHLDIKPQNILLDENLKVHLGDFDAAHVFKNNQSMKNVKSLTFSTKYTLEYASPEAKKGNKDLFESADLYSIGVLWCRLMHGTDALTKLINKHERETFLSTLAETAPKWMVDLIKKLLAINPKDRPKSARICLDIIETNTQEVEDFKTIVMSDDLLMSTLSIALSSEIEKILLTQGKVSEEQAIDLCKSLDKEQDNINIKDIFDLESAVKQQLILNNDLNTWFEWCDLLEKKAHIYANHKSKDSNTDEIIELLKQGQQSRYDDPQAALDLLKLKMPKQAAMLNKGSKANRSSTGFISLKYSVPVLVILFVFAYWSLNSYLMLDQQNDEMAEVPSTVFKQDKTNNITSKVNRPVSSDQLVLVAPLPLERKFSIDIASVNGEIENILLIEITATHSNNEQQASVVPFFAMETEVSRALYYLCVADGNCSKSKIYSTQTKSKPIEHPMTNVSWYEVNQQFIPWINTKVSGRFELPNLEQWKKFAIWPQSIASLEKLKQNTNCKNCGNINARTTRIVNLGKPNQLGLYDVYGNVQEWLSECWYDDDFERCDQAIVAGGSWFNNAAEIQQTHISQLLKHAKTPTTGFRLIYYPNE